ncbi:MAG: hypothetical protein ACREQM_02715 [Candidatus Dormibacteraceae bacterium]
MACPPTRVRDNSVFGRATATRRPLEAASPPRTVTRYTPTGDSIVVPLLDAWCPRCLQPWEWPRGLDADLDRQADRGLAVDVCPTCLDDLADLRAEEEGW